MNNEMGTELGKNKTGIMMSPKEATKTAEGAIKLTTPVPEGDVSSFAMNRIRYIQEADGLGTVPMPATVKGALSSFHEKMMSGSHAFMDKLGERIAFERTGTRLYESLLSKYMGSEDKKDLPPLEELQRFHDEELKHFQMACKVMTKVGGDPTAMTPSADLCGLAALGWVQAISDPRTTFKQSLEIILQAELVDNACWEVMIEMADNLGLKEVAEEFRVALAEESVHMDSVRRWVMELNLHNRVSRVIDQDNSLQIQ